MGCENFVQVMLDRFRERPGKPCMRFFRNGAWRDLTYAEVEARVRSISAALVRAGLRPGDRAAIFSRNRPEWALCDLAILFSGGVVAPVYADLKSGEAAYVLRHSDSRVVFVEGEKELEKVLSARGNLPLLERAVVFESPSEDDGFAIPLSDFEAAGDPAEGRERVEQSALAPSSTPLTLVYTSGTTGDPKGAVLTHGNAVGVVEAVLAAVGPAYFLDLNLSFLPLAHSLERVAGHFTPLYLGGTIAFSRGPEFLVEDFAAVRPEYAIAVPRFFEKVHDRIQAQMASQPAWKGRMARWALEVGRERSRLQEAGRPLPPGLRARCAVADLLVFSKIRRRLGGRLKYFISGGAPLAADLARFFHAAGILVCEGYGATETSAPATCNTPEAYRFGTVGRPLPGVEIRLDGDGEVLVRGPNVFAGYFKDPAATAAAFTPEGFYRTGDVGEMDADGFLRITDRKKELIITASGENIAPTKLENLLKARPGISSALVHCDRRPYVVALLTLDRPALDGVRPGLSAAPLDAPELLSHVRAQVDAVNASLSRVEQIKVYRVLEEDFSAEGGTMTLTFKLKRRVIEARYRQVLEEMYLGHVGRTGGL